MDRRENFTTALLSKSCVCMCIVICEWAWKIQTPQISLSVFQILCSFGGVCIKVVWCLLKVKCLPAKIYSEAGIQIPCWSCLMQLWYCPRLVSYGSLLVWKLPQTGGNVKCLIICSTYVGISLYPKPRMCWGRRANGVCLTPLTNTEYGAVWVTVGVSHLKRELERRF